MPQVNDPYFPRSSGVLLHITSLPGRFGIGDFGPAAYAFVDKLAAHGQTFWQVLPINPTGFGDSPYAALSSFAGNQNLISLEMLRDNGWLRDDELADHPPFRQQRVDYPAVITWHEEMLTLAYDRFLAADGPNSAAYTQFVQDNSAWLDDYTLYIALKEFHQQRPWHEWPLGEALRAGSEMRAARDAWHNRMAEHRFRQWVFDTQWRALKAHANDNGVWIIGDLPIYVADDSADVWANRDLFDLDELGRPRVVAGVPPDYFSETGQLWGNPIYLWNRHAASDFAWWMRRLAHACQWFDRIRIDHFRAFYDYWEVPAGAPNAIGGVWRDGPRAAFFDALQSQVKGCMPRIIAEDLGDKMEDVRRWMRPLNLPGMKITQFAFGDHGDEAEQFKPEKANGKDTLAIRYTGTHDNNTIMGWWHTEARPHFRQRVEDVLRDWDLAAELAARSPAWALIRLGLESADRVAIAPVQDLLSMGKSARMNKPGEPSGWWRWRVTAEELDDDETWHHLLELTRASNRLPPG